MNHYPTSRLGKVLTLERDEVLIEASEVYRTAGIRGFGRGLFARPQLAGASTSYTKYYRLHTDQVVFSRLFGWEGAVALVPAEFDGWFVSSEFPTLTVDRSLAEPAFLGHLARWSRFHNQLAGVTRGLGQRRQRVHVEDILALEIPLPPIDEQRRIAHRLDRLQAAAAELARHSSHASALMRALGASASARPDLDDDAKGRDGWRRAALGEVLMPSTNQVQVEPTGRYEIAGAYSFGRGLIDRGAIAGSETSYKTLTVLNEGDIVVSKLNGWEGAVAVVGEHFDGFYVSSEYPTFKPDTGRLLPAFFGGIARSPWLWEALNSNARGSMIRRRRINSTEFLGTQVWLPPIAIQVRVANWLERVDRASQTQHDIRARTGALVPAALNEVFAGLS